MLDLQAIRRRMAAVGDFRTPLASRLFEADMPALLAEVERLKAALNDLWTDCQAIVAVADAGMSIEDPHLIRLDIIRRHVEAATPFVDEQVRAALEEAGDE